MGYCTIIARYVGYRTDVPVKLSTKGGIAPFWVAAILPENVSCDIGYLERRYTGVGFQTGGLPNYFWKRPDCVADPFGTVPRRYF